MDAQETRIYTTVLIASVVIACIIVYFVISIVRQQRKNLELHKKNILAEIAGIEKDRARIAADLHDELGPMLSAVKMKMNSFDLVDPEDKIQIEKTNKHIDDILKRMRDISYDLMPTTLARKGLVKALQEFINFTSNGITIQIDLFVSGEILLTEEKSINIYRMMQEIIQNTVKHAGASHLALEFKKEKDKLIITSKDNGVGFDPDAMQHIQGIGLRNLLSRTQLLNGEIFLESKKGTGTEYTFKIPY